MENDINQNKEHTCWSWCCGCNAKHGSVGWGIFFLALGSYFFLKEAGFISFDVSVWTLILVAFGLYLIIRKFVK